MSIRVASSIYNIVKEGTTTLVFSLDSRNHEHEEDSLVDDDRSSRSIS